MMEKKMFFIICAALYIIAQSSVAMDNPQDANRKPTLTEIVLMHLPEIFYNLPNEDADKPVMQQLTRLFLQLSFATDTTVQDVVDHVLAHFGDPKIYYFTLYVLMEMRKTDDPRELKFLEDILLTMIEKDLIDIYHPYHPGSDSRLYDYIERCENSPQLKGLLNRVHTTYANAQNKKNEAQRAAARCADGGAARLDVGVASGGAWASQAADEQAYPPARRLITGRARIDVARRRPRVSMPRFVMPGNQPQQNPWASQQQAAPDWAPASKQ